MGRCRHQEGRTDASAGRRRAEPGPRARPAVLGYADDRRGLNGLHWSWVKVVPVDDPPTADDPYTYEDTPLFTFDAPIVTGIDNACEANRNRGIEPDTVVLLSFTGYDRTGKPLYVFQHSGLQADAALRIHDHRDNLHGGFAFSVYHPGTALPQQPFAV